MKGIPCENIEDKLVAYVGNELPQVEMEYIRKHLASCEACKREVNELEGVLLAIDQAPEFQPNMELQQNFEDMLNAEKVFAKQVVPKSSNIRRLWSSPIVQIAASTMILTVGIWIGMQVQLQNRNEDVADLKNDLQDMKQLVMLSMLEKSSASERIKAVYTVSEMEEPSEQVLEALIETLNKDKNVNVRLAAISALNRFSANEEIRHATIEALSQEDDVIVQIALINLLVSWEEKRATNALKDLLKKQETPEVVKEQAEMGLQMLM